MKPSYQPKAVFISWVPTVLSVSRVLKPRGAVIWHKLYSTLLGPRSQTRSPTPFCLATVSLAPLLSAPHIFVPTHPPATLSFAPGALGLIPHQTARWPPFCGVGKGTVVEKEAIQLPCGKGHFPLWARQEGALALGEPWRSWKGPS